VFQETTVVATGPADAPHPVAAHFFNLAQQAARRGDLEAAEQLCASVLALDPGQTAASQFLISQALDPSNPARSPARALDLSLQALDCARASTGQSVIAQLHFLHGCALEALGERESARAAFTQAHALDDQMFLALFSQGVQEEALGMADAHLRTYQRALNLAQRVGAFDDAAPLTADARQRIEHAATAIHNARAAAVEQALAPIRTCHGSAAIVRIEQAAGMCLGDIDIAWAHPLQRPTFMLIPGLEPRPWFEREEFGFLADIEQHTAVILDELRAVLADASALSPYVDMPDAAPATAVWRDLNRSARWSSYHLFRHGERVDAHCQRCPRTLAALESTPLMRIPEHSPEAVFSLLQAGTHIPPHTGVMNGRLTVHLPLIVPADCGALKAGDEARTWTAGRCLIFDDSFTHEAWNHCGEDRAVLIFDIWDPRLSEAEREAVSAVIAAIGRFNRAYCDEDATQEAH
jgi:aspartate beta-hydroxylase